MLYEENTHTILGAHDLWQVPFIHLHENVLGLCSVSKACYMSRIEKIAESRPSSWHLWRWQLMAHVSAAVSHSASNRSLQHGAFWEAAHGTTKSLTSMLCHGISVTVCRKYVHKIEIRST